MRKRLAIGNGPAIAAFRAARGLSQPALAERTQMLATAADSASAPANVLEPRIVKVSEATIAMIEAGRRHPSPNVLHTLAVALDVPVESIGRITTADHTRCPECDGSGMTALAL